jgi:cytochrome c oxidase assembly protein subunit 15
MVKSGLDQQLMQDPNAVPRVSPVRLASHLGSAFILYVGFMKLGWDVLKPKSLLPTPSNLVKFAKASHGVTGLIFLTAMSGALVAGLDAGMIYNEFPYMGETIVPALHERWNTLFAKDPKTGEGMWHNFINNPTLVQFNHRVLAVTTFCSVMGLYAYSRNLALNRSIRVAVRLMAGIAIIQVSLGIGTLIYSVPINLAAAHQSGSLALLTSGVWLMHTLKRIPK